MFLIIFILSCSICIELLTFMS